MKPTPAFCRDHVDGFMILIIAAMMKLSCNPAKNKSKITYSVQMCSTAEGQRLQKAFPHPYSS
jgi:hypothetical protein